MLAAAPAATAGWRVIGLVTAVARRIRSVVAAAAANATYTSLDRFCESTTPMPPQPCASTARARVATARGDPAMAVHTSTRRRCCCGGDVAGVVVVRFGSAVDV